MADRIDLEGRVAVVTGGARGIGLACAGKLAAGGARLALWDQDLDEAKAAAVRLGQGALAVACEVADEAGVAEALARTEGEAGPVDVLVHAAGIAGPNHKVADYPLEDWRRVVEVDLTGTFLVNKAITPGMAERGFGRVVNVASVAGKEGNPNACAYSAAKAGVIALTKSLGKELAHLNVAVNCVTPAAARTRIFDQMSQEHIDYMLSKIPRARFLEVDEAAAMIVWLCSAENSFATGAVFDLSGGRATY